MTNKELKNKIEKYQTNIITGSEEMPSGIFAFTEDELMDLIKEVVESIIPEEINDNWREEDYNEAIKDMKDNLDKLLKE